MKVHQAEFPLTAMCGALGLSTSGYYDPLKRPPSERERRDEARQSRVEAVWRDSEERWYIKVYSVETDGDDRKAMFISVHQAGK